jgi:hypothetical protein
MTAASRPLTRPQLSPQLEERLTLHKEEVARLREEIGDPQEALFALVRDSFSAEALTSGYRRLNGQWVAWDDDDDLDAW